MATSSIFFDKTTYSVINKLEKEKRKRKEKKKGGGGGALASSASFRPFRSVSLCG